MSLRTEWLRYGNAKQYSGYLAIPEKAQTPLPVVIVFQEIWGADEHIQDVTRRFAQAGYAAFAPDLYARNGERQDGLQADRIEKVKAFLEVMPPTAWHSQEERDKALATLPGDDPKIVGETFGRLFSGSAASNYTEQLLETVNFLRHQLPETTGQKIAAVGYCMGGALAAHLAAHDKELAGAVMYYGRSPSDELIPNIDCPVRAFYGELDTNLTATAPALAEAMKKAGKDFEYMVYPDAHHAFFNDGRRSYGVKASRDAFARTLGYFAAWLSD